MTYLYAPDRSPRAFRWTALAERWADGGHEVAVIAAGAPGTERRNGVTVHRIPGWLRRTATVGAGGGPRRTSFVKAVYDRTLKRVLWPDYAFDWYVPALRRARAIGADRLVTVSHPFTPHLIGFALERRRWLVDIGDPFSFLDETPLNNASLYRNLNRIAERRVLASADVIAVTVESARAAYAAAFPECAGKIAVVPPLLSLPEAGANPLPPAAGIHLVFVGTLYRALRSPAPLLALFQEMRQHRPDLALHFFGDVHDCRSLFEPLPSGVHLHGAVPRETAAAAMRHAAALVNIGNATPHQVPSKLVEYAAAARPIVNVAASPADTSANFLAGHPALCRAHDAAGVLRFLDERRSVPADWVERFLAPYRLDAVARAYEQLLGM